MLKGLLKGIREDPPRAVRASYTVEAAGVMAVVLLTVMVLLNQAFYVRTETVGEFAIHEEVERERHLISNIDEGEISRQSGGGRWRIEIISPVFRPENFLRMWSLLEGAE